MVDAALNGTAQEAERAQNGDYDDAVSVSGPGVIDNHDGTWSWSGTGDEDHPYDVMVTATNAHGSQNVTVFHVSFTDVPPTIAAISGSVSAAENATAHNSGTCGDYDDVVSVSGPGVVDNHNGTWTWSGTGDEDHPYDVAVTASNVVAVPRSAITSGSPRRRPYCSYAAIELASCSWTISRRVPPSDPTIVWPGPHDRALP